MLFKIRYAHLYHFNDNKVHYFLREDSKSTKKKENEATVVYSRTEKESIDSSKNKERATSM